MRRKIGRLLYEEMETPFINFGQTTILRRYHGCSTWTGIDQGHFSEQGPGGRALHQHLADAHVG